MEKLYTVGKWRGHPQYKCSLCPFDVLDNEQDILDHIQNAHMPKVEPEKPVTASGIHVIRDQKKKKAGLSKAGKKNKTTRKEG